MTPEDRQKLDEVYSWMETKKRQQLDTLDPSSEEIVRTHLPVFSRYIASTITPTGRIYLNIDGVEFQVPCKPTDTSVTTYG